MLEKVRSPRITPARHSHGGLKILYEDKDIIVVDKTSGLLTMATASEKEHTAYSILNDHVKRGNSRSRDRVFIVHRLDRDTSGVIIFAKNDKAKRFLQDNWKEFTKTYFAVVLGRFAEKEGIIISYLVENKAYKMYSVDDPAKGKFSKTGYKVLVESNKFSLLEIHLFTGTKNQVRVQLSENGHPVAGDKIYGQPDKSIKRLALHSASLSITHPVSKKIVTFKAGIPRYFKELVKV